MLAPLDHSESSTLTSVLSLRERRTRQRQVRVEKTFLICMSCRKHYAVIVDLGAASLEQLP